MRLVTWNINGIRSLKSDWKDVLSSLDADIICLQETKVTRDNLDEATALVDGYSSYFSFSRKRTGYSGVATFCRPDFTPWKCEEGLTGSLPSSKFDDSIGFCDGIEEEFSAEDLRALDSEGRCVLTSHQVEVDGKPRSLVLFNVYCPRTDHETPGRQSFQLKFYKLIEIRANALMKSGHIVIIVGDINTSHKELDHCDPYEEFGERPGRKWLDHFLVSKPNSETFDPNSETSGPNSDSSEVVNPNSDSSEIVNPISDSNENLRTDWMVNSESIRVLENSFVDSFRKFHPERESAFTCWMTRTNCRENNYGTRLDYIFVSAADSDSILTGCDIHPDIMGSDHCPVMAIFNLKSIPSAKPPKYCTKYFVEFGGRQQKLSAFFSQNSNLETSRTFLSTSQNSEKRKSEENGIEQSSSAPKKSKVVQQQQKSLLSFFKPKNPAKIEVPKQDDLLIVQSQENESLSQVEDFSKFEDFNPEKRVQTAEAWKSLMKKPPATPLCPGHREPADLKTVKKKGPNCGRQFWCCARGEGKAGDPNTRCEFFKWRK